MSSEKEIQPGKYLSTIPHFKESGGLTLSTREDRQIIQAVDAAALLTGRERSYKNGSKILSQPLRITKETKLTQGLEPWTCGLQN